MADISSITLPGGGTYDLKDKNAVPKYGMGKNLLDNWYFLGTGSQDGQCKYPINQRGKTTYTGSIDICIDRWRLTNSMVTATLQSTGLRVVTANSLSYSAGIQQKIYASNIPNGVYTLSVLTTLGLNTCQANIDTSDGSWRGGTSTAGCWVAVRYMSNTGTFDFNITARDATIIAVKLEPGTQQTLCHNEGTDANPVWVLNEIPDYEEELIKCQTSTDDPSDTFANKSLATEQQLAYVETGTTASRAYAVGEYFCWNGLLYRATTAISSGASFTVGTNCESVTGGGFNHLFSRVNHITQSFYVSSRKSSNGSTTTTFTTDSTIAGTYGYILILGEKSDASTILTLAIVHNGGLPASGKKNLGNYSIDVALSGNTLTITATDNWCNYYIMSTYHWV